MPKPASPFSDFGNWVAFVHKPLLAALKDGLDPNTTDALGTPVVVQATRLGSWELFELAIVRGANPSSRTPEGATAFHYGLRGVLRANNRFWSKRQIKECGKIADFYLENDLLAPGALATYAIALNELAMLKSLMENGLDPNTRIEDPSAALLSGDASKSFRERSKAKEQRVKRIAPTLLSWAEALGRSEIRDYLSRSELTRKSRTTSAMPASTMQSSMQRTRAVANRRGLRARRLR